MPSFSGVILSTLMDDLINLFNSLVCLTLTLALALLKLIYKSRFDGFVRNDMGLLESDS